MSANESIHEAADALAAYASDVFWRDDSPFQRGSLRSYKSAAAWLHEYADGVTEDTATHLFEPDENDKNLSLCGDLGPTTTSKADVTCGRCRIGSDT